MFRRIDIAALAVVASIVMAGCTSIGLRGEESDLYVLTPKSTYSDDMPYVDWQLVIEEPVAAGGLDASRIALKPTSTRFDYFAGARWTERAPVMVQTLIIESFESSERIVSVGRQSIGLRSDFNLKLELREFQAEYAGPNSAPSVRVKINAKLVSQPRQKIIASRSFEQVRQADSDNMSVIVEQFDRALGRVMKDLVGWTLEFGQSHGSAKSS